MKGYKKKKIKIFLNVMFIKNIYAVKNIFKNEETFF